MGAKRSLRWCISKSTSHGVCNGTLNLRRVVGKRGNRSPQLCRLTHSIIQARRCRRVNMRCRSLVSASSTPVRESAVAKEPAVALATCPDGTGEGHTHFQRCVWLHVRETELCSHTMLCLEAGDGFHVLAQIHVASPESCVRLALPRPVAHLLCNRQALRMVLDGLVNVPLRHARNPRFPNALHSPARSLTSFAIARHCVWYSMEKSLSD